DVFVLLSREDPFPLIVLEAAFLYKPIIAFENSGGIPEFIEHGAGMLAPYLDTSEIARKVYQLSRDNERKDKIGQKAHELVITKYSSDIIAPEIYRTISSLLTKC